MQKKGPMKQAGFTFAELTFAMLILVTSAAVLINHISVNYATTNTERDRVFAYSKAQAILSEIQGFVDRGNVDAAVDLDVLDDGIVSKNPLTIQTESGSLVAADHAVSGNYQRNGEWVWSRRITVQPFAGLDNRNVRYVTVRIFKRDKTGAENPMADLSAVINSAGDAFPTTQVYDVYLLAIENIPGWWVFMDSIKPFVESMITDLENRNPGLVFRTHWITKAAFGRNEAYRPYTNETNDSHAVIPSVYHYPGRMPSGNASTYYYVPDNIKARIDVDGTEQNGYSATSNPVPYALADFFNHAMRYPDELQLWQDRVKAIEDREVAIENATLLGLPAPPELDDMSKEPTYRLFLEDLCTDSDKYRNALIINLHGELLPMPALRNYSDAASDPLSHPGWRCVTHPEELRTRNNDGGATDPLRFRMYAYTNNAVNYGAYGGSDRMTEPMVVDLMNVDLIDYGDPDSDRISSLARLAYVPGGVMVNGDNEYATSWQSAVHEDDASFPGEEMYYRAEFVTDPAIGGPCTRIYLYNTPVVAPIVTNSVDSLSYGVANSIRARLYGMEYVPSPIDAGPAFTTDLTSPGTGVKNTARWTLELDPGVLSASIWGASGTASLAGGDLLFEVRTRIASNYEASGRTDVDWQKGGVTFPSPMQPTNLSKTYAWWTDSAEDVPMTERAQFNGDPRHVPYKDCFSGGDDFPDTYNWYHDSLANNSENAAGDFGSLNGGYLANRWNGAMSCDVPRYFELLRTAMVESSCVYTTLTGWSYYYLGIGNDIGYDAANGYPNSIPSDLTPHYGTGTGYINTITSSRRYVMTPLGGAALTPWETCYPWLGELYPEELAALYLDDTSGWPEGNLPAGTGLGQAFQYENRTAYLASSRLAYGTACNNYHQRTSGDGCSAFFNIGTASSRFRHLSSSGNGNLTAVGQEIADNYSMTMPSAAPVSRPFSLNYGGTGGSHWNHAPYNGSNRYTGTLFETYYTHSAGIGSGIVKLVNPSNTKAGYVVVNGIDKAVESGTTFIAKFAVLSLVHSFLEAGDTGNTLRIQQLPRLEIDSPTDITELNDPSSIDVRYGVDWTRWDGEAYTTSGAYSESESELEYVLMYSPDNGTSWRHMQDDSMATPGERPSDNLVIESDGGAGDETYTWAVPSATFVEGSYLIRIDCYRQGAQVHYSWHQNKIFIQR